MQHLCDCCFQFWGTSANRVAHPQKTQVGQFPKEDEFDKHYELLKVKEVGSGVSGKVLLAQVRGQTAESTFAVKMLKTLDLSERKRAEILREGEIYAMMDHQYIVKLMHLFAEQSKCTFVMEYASGGSLSERLLKQGYLVEPRVVSLTRQMFAAVNYLHTHPSGRVCHRDLGMRILCSPVRQVLILMPP